MALSGSFTGTTANSYIQPKITWSAEQSISGNYSTVTAKLYYSRTNTGYTTNGTWSGSITINGKKKTGSKSVSITYNSNTHCLTYSVQVPHNADGTKSVTISATGAISGTTLSSTSISKTVTLDAIPRISKPTTSVPSAYMGEKVMIFTNRESTALECSLHYSFAGGPWVLIENEAPDALGWTIPDLATSIPNANAGILTIRSTTYVSAGMTKVGIATTEILVKVPEDLRPTISKVTLAEATTGIAAQFGAYIQNKSTIKATITAAGVKGSTIKSYSTTFAGKTYTSSSFTTPVLTGSGSYTMKVTVKDSRGKSATTSVTVNVLAYAIPKITRFKVYRCKEDGTAATNGTALAVNYAYTVTSLNGKNTADAQIQYKLGAAATYEDDPIYTCADLTCNETRVITSPAFSIDYQYNIRMTVVDWFGETATYSSILPSDAVILDIKADGKGVSFGKTAELSNYLDIEWDAMLRKNATFVNSKTINGTTPDGEVREIMRPQNNHGNLVIGYGLYDAKSGDTNLYGRDIHLNTSNVNTPSAFRPYRRAGDTVSVYIRTSGYVTDGGKQISFVVPMAVPAVGAPVVTASSVNGFAFRQAGNYTHGSSATKTVTPNSYTASVTYPLGVTITATFTDVTNVVNNDAIGIYWNGNITFS